MIKMLAKTYRTAPLSHVLAALDLKDAESLKSFGSKEMLVVDSAEEGASGSENQIPVVEKVEGDLVTFSANADNSQRGSSGFKEGVNYDDVASMMSKTSLRGQ